MNELKITGKVVNAYTDGNGHFVCTIVNTHNHVVDRHNTISESYFRGFLMDKVKSAHTDVMKGDKVTLHGYLRQDIIRTSGGNEKHMLRIYLTDIEVLA